MVQAGPELDSGRFAPGSSSVPAGKQMAGAWSALTPFAYVYYMSSSQYLDHVAAATAAASTASGTCGRSIVLVADDVVTHARSP